MCLSVTAFGLFLSLFSPHALSVEDGHVILHTADREMHWLALGPVWCTGETQLAATHSVSPAA